MPKIPGLQRRRKSYYLRISVPTDLQKIFNKGEKIIPLGTRDYTEACRRIHIERAKIESEFQQERVRLKNNRDNQDMLSDYGDHDLQALYLRWLDEVQKKIEAGRAKNKCTSSKLEQEECYQDLENEDLQAHQELIGASD